MFIFTKNKTNIMETQEQLKPMFYTLVKEIFQKEFIITNNGVQKEFKKIGDLS